MSTVASQHRIRRPRAPEGRKRRIASCVCTEAGVFNSGIAGILLGLARVDGSRLIERCDSCERFNSDDAACIAFARAHGGTCRFGTDLRVVWAPER